jgi:hypothetical protein
MRILTRGWRAWAAVTLGAGSLAAAALTPTAAQAATPGAHTLTLQQIAALPQARQEALLGPLRALAGAVDEIGRGSAAATYANVVLDPVADTVKIYLTDPAAAPGLLAAAKRNHPGIDTALARILTAAYPKRQLDAARDRLLPSMARPGSAINSVAVATDGSGLIVGESGANVAHLAASAGVPVTVTAGHTIQDYTRFADFAPYWAGAYIDIGYNGGYCTTGVPVQSNSSSQQYIVTASHCARTGVAIHNGAGAYEGTVSAYNTLWDASIYPVSSAGPYEWDGTTAPYFALHLIGTAYSYDGDLVCQDGYTSLVVCGIQVTNQDLYITQPAARYPSFVARGVWGEQVNGGIAGRPGDSGGLVFTINQDGVTRQVRGIVSGGDNGSGMFWTEALDIYNHLGVHLVT